MADDPINSTPAPAPSQTPNNTPSPSPPPTKPWYEGKADQETIGHWNNKGWKIGDPAEIAIEATRAARSLEKHMGVPLEQLLKLPKDTADDAGWNAVYNRLGRPAQAKDYDLSSIRFSDGEELDAGIPGFTDKMRGALHAAGVAKDKATAVVKTVVDLLDGIMKTDATDRDAALKTERETLAKDWGTNFEFNRLTAMQGAKRMGVDPQTVATLESALGYAKVMEMFRRIGAGTTEDTFVTSGQGGMPTTQTGAVARRQELMNDQAWVKRYLAGDAAARREMDGLNVLISGVAA